MPYKLPQSVLVLIHTENLQVLLLERADRPGFWQSVTGSRDEGEALIRKSIRELAEELDPQRFVQTHRSVIVNLGCVSEVLRGVNETAELHLRGRNEILPVSRNFLHYFRQM